MRAAWILVLWGLAWIGPVRFVWAEEGEIEISQATALAGGPTDPASFPVVIEAPGRYVLTSSLDLTAVADPANTDAINIDANDVTLDLNGFRILGSTDCSELPESPCTGTGSGVGIRSNMRIGTAIQNGTVRVMGDAGVNLEISHASRIKGIRAYSNGGYGIWADGSAFVGGCVVLQNGQTGISAGRGEVRENVASLNGGSGVEGQSVVQRNVMFRNGGFGLLGGTTYAENLISLNSQDGVQVSGIPLPAGPNACAYNAVCP